LFLGKPAQQANDLDPVVVQKRLDLLALTAGQGGSVW